jgi:hypothetical protein
MCCAGLECAMPVVCVSSEYSVLCEIRGWFEPGEIQTVNRMLAVSEIDANGSESGLVLCDHTQSPFRSGQAWAFSAMGFQCNGLLDYRRHPEIDSLARSTL